MSEDDYKRAMKMTEIPGPRPTRGATGLCYDDVRLVCEALIEANKDKARLTKLIELSDGPDADSWLSDVAFDHALELEVPEEHADDSQHLIRAAIDREMER